jgi:hypothetical protein
MSLRNCAPYPGPIHGYHIGRAVIPSHALPPAILYNYIFYFEEGSSSVTTAGGGAAVRCQDTGWRARIKGSVCGLLRIDELDASVKVTLVMDSSIWVILEVALWPCDLIGHLVSPWPLRRDLTDSVVGSWSVRHTTDGESATHVTSIANHVTTWRCPQRLLGNHNDQIPLDKFRLFDKLN